MANEGLEVDPDGSTPADGSTVPGATETHGTSDDTVEAVRAVIQAAIDVGRQVLDALERTLRDPATAEKLSELASGLAGAVDGLRPIVDVTGLRVRTGPPVERITIDDVIDDELLEDGEAS